MSTVVLSEPTRSVVQVNGISILYINQDGSVELPNAPVGTGANRVLTASQMPFSKEYTSAGQPIVPSSVVTLTHGLGTNPKLITAYLQCTSPNLNYAVGDKVCVPIGVIWPGADANTTGISVHFTPTSLSLAFAPRAGGTFFILDKTSGTLTPITNASWQLYIKAFA